MKNIFFTLLLLLISILTKAQNAGIGVAAPQEKLDVDGAIRMGTTTNTNAGTIRWNPDRNDFEGYNGDRWVSLTGNAGQWGRQDDYSFEDGATDFILKFVNNDFGEGLGVSIDGDTSFLFLGAGLDHTVPDLTHTGRVYTIKQTPTGEWSAYPDAEIQAPSPQAGEQLGHALAYNSGRLVISAPGYSNFKGRVLAYDISPEGVATYRQAFAASDGTAFDWFGFDIAVSHQFVFVSSPFKESGGNVNVGKVYVYRYNTGTNLWTFVQGILPPDGHSNDNFGTKVTIDGNRAAISSPEKQINGQYVQGKVYTYIYNGLTWVLQQEIMAPDGDEFDHFGNDLKFSGDTLFIGAPEHEFPSHDEMGKVYMYVWSGTQWQYQGMITPIVSQAGQGFGYALDYRDGHLLVGAPRYAHGKLGYAGLAYLYKYVGGQFIPQVALAPTLFGEGDKFGYQVRMTTDCAIITSPFSALGHANNNGNVHYYYK